MQDHAMLLTSWNFGPSHDSGTGMIGKSLAIQLKLNLEDSSHPWESS